MIKLQNNFLFISVIALLTEIIVNICCLGCIELEYVSQKGFVEKYIDQLYEPTDIVIPVQNTVDEQRFFTIPYQTLMFVQEVSIIAKKVKNPPKDMMTTLFWSLLRTWPLLMMAVSLAMAAGCVIWLLVYFYVKIVLHIITQPTHDVQKTLLRRRFNFLTSF